MRIPSTIIFFLLLACSGNKTTEEQPDPYAKIADLQTSQVIEKAIDKAGTLKTWEAIRTIEYTKRGVLLLENGDVESDVTQRHRYVMRPEFEAEISWVDGVDSIKIIHNASQTRKIVNGRDVTENERPLMESVMSSLYVLGMPFKLMDPGTNLTYVGRANLRTGDEVDVIKATYAPDKHKNHSTTDEWYYYFEKKSGDFKGCMVYHPPTYALIENLEFHEDLPVLFHKHRKSYRSDSLRNIKYLRAEFWYWDYSVELMK